MNKELMTEFKRSLWLAIPLIIALLSETGMRLVDSIMLGYLGPAALAAGALAVSAYMLILVIMFGLMSAVGICMAQARGAGHNNQLTHYFQQGVYFCVLVCIPLMLLIWNVALLFPWLKQDVNLSLLAGEYLKGATWGTPALLGFLLLRELSATVEKPTVIMVVALVALPVNGLLDYAFIFGRWGLPQWGVYGVGFTSSIVQWAMLISVNIYCLRVKKIREYLFAKFAKPKLKQIKHILSIGLPAGSVFLFEMGLFSVATFMMGHVGMIQLAAHQVVIQYVDFEFVLVLGIAQAAAIRIAHSVGSKDFTSVRNVVKVSVILALTIAGVFSLIFFCFPGILTDIFIDIDNNQYPLLAMYAKQFFLVAIFLVFFDVLQVLGNNILRGLKDAVIPMFLGISSYWIVGILIAYLLTFKWHLGGVGIWYGIVLGLMVSAIILWWRWFYVIAKLD